MSPRLILAAVFTLSLSSTAFANCQCPSQTAYSVHQQNGVTVMRGKIPKNSNPKRALIADRKAADQRADMAEQRARSAEREARDARTALAARPVNTSPNYGSNRNRQSRYFSGNYRYGASVSRARFDGRGFGGGRGLKGKRVISRPVFANRIRF